jgi:glycosyltransferase involved in cell wall biosynthesis
VRICFIADARSPIAKSWFRHFVERGDRVSIISTYPCESNSVAGAELYQVPIAFAGFSRVGHDGRVAGTAMTSSSVRFMASLRSGAASTATSAMRHWLAPLEVRRKVDCARRIIERTDPELVHAMRIPYEGILAGQATPNEVPLAVSIWGNDLTLFAGRYPAIADATRETLSRADGLHCDCRRDMKLAQSRFGFDECKPSLVAPGAGGVRLDQFYDAEPNQELRQRLDLSEDARVVINPRGFRAYVRTEAFVRAVPAVLARFPQAVFLCPGLEGVASIEGLAKQVGVEKSLRLLPKASPELMAELFRLAEVSVSPTVHDGTPNSLIEAMACGCFPVAGDLESVREWISHGENGLLCDATESASLARSLIVALGDGQLRRRARDFNAGLVKQKADYDEQMNRADGFYQMVVDRKRRSQEMPRLERPVIQGQSGQPVV